MDKKAPSCVASRPPRMVVHPLHKVLRRPRTYPEEDEIQDFLHMSGFIQIWMSLPVLGTLTSPLEEELSQRFTWHGSHLQTLSKILTKNRSVLVWHLQTGNCSRKGCKMCFACFLVFLGKLVKPVDASDLGALNFPCTRIGQSKHWHWHH